MEPTVFQSQLDAMAKEGLNLPLFQEWYDENAQFIEWPYGALGEYFTSKVVAAGPGHLADRDYFRLLGVSDNPEKLKFFADYYRECEPLGSLPQDVLTMFFTQVASRARIYIETSHEVTLKRAESQPVAEAEINSNIRALSTGLPGQMVGITMQRPADHPCHPPTFERTDILLLQDLPDEEGLLYHSTELDRAASILATCPFTGPYSPRNRDMDKGAYYNVSPRPAQNWAQVLINRSGSDVAILVYRVPAEIRRQWRELLLVYGPEWATLVQAFRRQEFGTIDLRGIQTKYDVITGPALANPREVLEFDYPPIPLSFNEVCILDRALGASMNDYLMGVLVVRVRRE